MYSRNWRTYKQFIDNRGVLGVIDDRDIPFNIKRAFWISNVPTGQSRGHHSHKECEQAIVCLTGAFNVWLDGIKYELCCSANRALHISTGTKVILDGFSSDAVCLVLCSKYYDENDVRNE